MDEKETYVREHIGELADSAFPDNIGNEWIIHGIREQAKGLKVEVEPRPDDVGYTGFRFVINFSSSNKADIVECYCLEDKGEWSLLFTG